MNRFFKACLFVFIILSLSCEKVPHNVHFHGRITASCDSLYPAAHQQITLHRYYDTGTTGSEFLGYATTDENGYFDLITKVGQRGDFRSYIINMYVSGDIMERHFSCHMQSYNDGKNVEINTTAKPASAYGFHIKNVSPFDSTDTFNTLSSHFTFGNPHDNNLISDLTGIGIDTIIYRFYSISEVTYEYSYTKNGIFTVIPADTLQPPACLDTAIVDIFY